MTRLQEKLTQIEELKKQQKGVFDAYPDPGDIPAEVLTDVKSRNDALKNLEQEVADLTALESIKSATMGYTPSASVKQHGGQIVETATKSAPSFEFTRVRKIQNFKGIVDGKSADWRAYAFGKWFKGAIVGDAASKRWCQENGIESKALSEGNNYLGGYLVPPQFSNDIIDLREEYGVARRLARIVPMSSDTLTIPRRTGGLTAYFVGEGQAITPSDKTWDQVNLVAKKLACLTLWSSELSEDAIISIGDDLAGEIAYAFSLKEDECYFNGDGTSSFGGIIGIRSKLRNVDGTIGNIKGLEVATGTGYGTNYNSVTLADFHRVLGRLPLYARAGAAWVMSTTFFDSVAHRLQTAAGGNTITDIANGGVPRFLGYPVVFSQVLPVTSAINQIAALLGNFRLGTAMGDRRALTLALSTEYKFAEDQLAIRGTDRFDINVHDVGNTTAAGPIVGLITASS